MVVLYKDDIRFDIYETTDQTVFHYIILFISRYLVKVFFSNGELSSSISDFFF